LKALGGNGLEEIAWDQCPWSVTVGHGLCLPPTIILFLNYSHNITGLESHFRLDLINQYVTYSSLSKCCST
jgi:hypothetical protein